MPRSRRKEIQVMRMLIYIHQSEEDSPPRVK
jgi:hypothetical protein